MTSNWVLLDTLLVNYGIFPDSIYQERNICKRKGTESIYITMSATNKLEVNVGYLVEAKRYQLQQIELARSTYYKLLDIYTETDLIRYLTDRTSMTWESWYHFFYQQLFDSTCGKPDSLMSYQIPKRIRIFLHHIKGLL